MSVAIFGVYSLIGVFAGIHAGLMGLGGGILIVPALLVILPWVGLSDELAMHMAVGTSLAIIVVTSLSSIRAYHQRGAILWRLFYIFLPGLTIGSALGAWFASAISSQRLEMLFGLFILLVAFRMIFNVQVLRPTRIPDASVLMVTGTGIGAFCGMLGLGGGGLLVPFLRRCNIPIRRAVATAAACGLPVAFTGAVVFSCVGMDRTDLPLWSSGFIYWPAFVGIAVTSVCFAPVGVKLSARLHARVLQRWFGVLLVIIGIRMMM